MSEIQCLNCDEVAENDYCSHCGQATETSRLTLKELLKDHLFKALFSVDGSFFSTLKDLFLRPGHMAREYVNGKRESNFGPFKLLAVIAVVEAFFRGLRGFSLASTIGDPQGHHLIEVIEHARTSYQKWIIIGAIPFQALFSFAWFRSARLNYAEHFILNTFSASTGLVVSTLAWALTSCFSTLHPSIVQTSTYVSIAYAVVFHWQYFSKSRYSALSLGFRSVAASCSFYVILAVALGVYLSALAR